MSNKSDDEIAREFARTQQRESFARTQQSFFENELALAKVLLDVAESRYSIGFTEEAHRAKQEALTAIRTVRQFLAKPSVAPEMIPSITNRCDELESLVNNMGRTK